MGIRKKIRILHVSQSAGGVDRYIHSLLRYMNKEIYENILVCSQDFCVDKYKDLVIAVEQLKMSREINSKDLKLIVQIRRLIKKYMPDIIYAHSSKAGAIVRISNIGLNSQCVYNPHGWAFNMHCSGIKQKIYTIIERMAAPFCKKIICISEAEFQSALQKKICSKNKLRVIFNGIDIDVYEKKDYIHISKEELGIPNNSCVIGMVGRISTQKAPDIFVKTAALINEIIPTAHFVIVGSGEQDEKIKKLAEECGILKSLHITGWVQEPMSYIELFDVACLFSRWEGFGLVLPEYMWAEKPIVASNVDAIPNLIKNYRNGILIEPDNEVAAFEAIKEILYDSNLREKLIKQGKIDVKSRFNVKRVTKEHEKLFEELVNKKDEKIK